MILLIDNYDSFTYNLYQMVVQQAPAVKVVRNDKISIEEIKTLHPQAIILSPGPGYPSDAGICIELIHAFSGLIPLLGVCLGHQAIVEAFGGKIISAGEWVHGKASEVFHENQGILEGMPNPFQAARYHSLMADPTHFPDVLTVTAKTASQLIMGVQHQSHPTFGVQFHPESILTPKGTQLITTFLNISGVK